MRRRPAGDGSHVRRAQHTPPGRLPQHPRRRTAHRGERRSSAARDSSGAARGGRQLQGRQGIHRSRPRSDDGPGGPSQLDAGPAGRAHRARRDAGAVRRRQGWFTASERHATRHHAPRAAGLGQDDDRRQARTLARQAGPASVARFDRRTKTRGDPAADRYSGRRRSCASTIRRASSTRSRARRER